MHNQQSIRVSSIFFIFCCAYIAIIINLFLLQVRHTHYFKELGQRQYHTIITHKPDRALITDRTGKHILALNKTAIAAFVCPSKMQDPDTLCRFLADHFPQAAERLPRYSSKHFMYVQRNLSDEQQALIEQAALEDMCLLKEPHRYYPHAHLAPIVGITNIDNKGIMGIEQKYNDRLSAQETKVKVMKDARSGYFYFETPQTDITLPEPVRLTIDADIQFLAYEQLQATVQQFNAKQGSVLVMDPTNGEIIVMANYPTFDPNNRHTNDLTHIKNYCIAEQYELGSVMKVFTALAALEEELVSIDEPIDCKNLRTAYLDGRRVNTWRAHDILSFSEVIEKSNNIGTAIVAQRLGPLLYDHLRRVGFGTQTGIELSGELPGFVNPPATWSKQSIISLSYGYEISATLLQLAQAFGIIANNGICTSPTICMQQTPHQSAPLYSEQAIHDIKEILKRTTQKGTARRARMQGYDVMCKTGTANLLENGVYIDSKNSYTCAGIIQKDAYKRIIVTYVREADHPRLYASQVAVPLFEQVAQKMLIHDRIL